MAWSTSAATPVFPGRIRPCRMHHALPGAVQKEEDSVMPVYRVAFEEQGGSRVACQIHAALDANHLALAVQKIWGAACYWSWVPGSDTEGCV